MSSSFSSGTFRALVCERNSRCMAVSGLGSEHRVHRGRGLARGQALEFGSSCRHEQRVETAPQVELRLGQQLAVAHSQEQRAAGFSGKLP